MNNCLSAIEAITKLLFLPKSVPERADVCIVLGNDYLDTVSYTHLTLPTIA